MKTKKPSLGELEMADGSLTNDSQNKANTLNKCFASVLEIEGEEELPTFPDYQYNQQLVETEISDDKLLKA